MPEWLHKNAFVTAAVSLVILGAAAWFAVRYFASSGTENQFTPQVYFYDLNTKELFAVPADTRPPIETDSGPFEGMPAGVKAHVFMQGERDYFIGYLETAVDALSPDQRPEEPCRYAIRSVDGDRWLHPQSEEANAVLEQVRRQGLAGRDRVQIVQPVTSSANQSAE